MEKDKDQIESSLASDTNENISIEQTEDISLPDNVEHEVTNTSDATNHADELVTTGIIDEEMKTHNIAEKIVPIDEEVINYDEDNAIKSNQLVVKSSKSAC